MKAEIKSNYKLKYNKGKYKVNKVLNEKVEKLLAVLKSLLKRLALMKPYLSDANK